MIITITGKPCSGKGTVSKEFCKKYNFKYICTGDMFRELANQYGYSTVLEFQQNYPNIEEIDKIIDNKTTEMGENQLQENIVIDSRLAWNFIPNSFKVFIDVDWQVAGERLFTAGRQNEQAKSPEEASKILKERWETENSRYSKIYNTNNLNPNNYNLVISSNNLTPEEVVEIIHKEYQEFMQKA